jgi:hypothetical protein
VTGDLLHFFGALEVGERCEVLQVEAVSALGARVVQLAEPLELPNALTRALELGVAQAPFGGRNGQRSAKEYGGRGQVELLPGAPALGTSGTRAGTPWTGLHARAAAGPRARGYAAAGLACWGSRV